MYDMSPISPIYVPLYISMIPKYFNMINVSINIQSFLFIFISLDSIDLPKFNKIINN